jgi:micrococcal nuclease
VHFLLLLTLAAVATVQAVRPATTSAGRPPVSLSPSLKRSEAVLVRAVIDGRTIAVATVGRIRLLGLEPPDAGGGVNAAPLDREARERLAALVLNHWVRLEQETDTGDVRSRHLAYVMREDGLFVNAILVREGLARVTARLPLARLHELQAAEREAQMLRRGMWGQVPQPGVHAHGEKPRTVTRKMPGRYTSTVKPSSRRARSPKRTDRPRPPQPAP